MSQPAQSVRVSNRELATVREAMRELHRLLAQLQAGEVDKVVLTQSIEQARTIGRPAVQYPYLGLRNYTSNLVRHGFTEADVAGSGSDALVDALVAHGSVDAIYRQLDDHLYAGADHVGIQVFTTDHGASPMDAFRLLSAHRPKH